MKKKKNIKKYIIWQIIAISGILFGAIMLNNIPVMIFLFTVIGILILITISNVRDFIKWNEKLN